MKSFDNVADKDIFTPRKTEFTPEMARYGLTKYDIEASDKYYNETQGGKLIPHEETMQDLKNAISKYQLYNSEEELEDELSGNGHIGAPYLTKDEKNEIREYFKQHFKPVSTKTFDEVENENVKKATQEIDNTLAKTYRSLYENNEANIDIKPFKNKNGNGYKIEFNAELDYDDMEDMHARFDKILDKYKLDGYFEMEDSGRSYAYIFL